MAKQRMTPENLLPALADYVLQHGLSDVSLRPLAKAIGTSDRMLLYHFGSKSALIAALLDYLARNYAEALDKAFPQAVAASRKECVMQVLAIVRTDPFRPFMRLWWDIIAGAASGNDAYRESAKVIAEQLLDWFEAHMPQDDPDPKQGAKLLFTLIEGALMLDVLDQGHLADAGIAAAEL